MHIHIRQESTHVKDIRKNRRISNWLPLVATGLMAATLSHAQEKNEEVDKIFSWVTPSSPGCAVAASQDGKVVINRTYGLADLERTVSITPESVFDAGSVRKQFIAAAILLLVEEGKLSHRRCAHAYSTAC